MNEYQEFLKQKQKAKEHKGFAALPMNDKLFPFQQFIVERNLSKGKHAVFADEDWKKVLKPQSRAVFLLIKADYHMQEKIA